MNTPRVLQILVTLIHNAKYACTEGTATGKRLALQCIHKLSVEVGRVCPHRAVQG